AATRGRSHRPRARPGAVGGRLLSGDRRSRRSARDRDDLGTAMLHAPPRRGLASRPRAASHSRPHPADDRRIQLRRPVSAIPRPLGGGLVKAEWFKRYRENERPERFERTVQSWDTANQATELS